MKTVEMRYVALYCCPECGQTYTKPIIHRTGNDAREHFRRQLGVAPEGVDAAVREILSEGGMSPAPEGLVAGPAEGKITSLTLSNAKCPSGHPNLPVGKMVAFTCEECGTDTHMIDTNRGETVNCGHCFTIFKADYSLIRQ